MQKNQHKQCPHTDTMQVQNPGITETFCRQCNECVDRVTTRKYREDQKNCKVTK